MTLDPTCPETWLEGGFEPLLAMGRSDYEDAQLAALPGLHLRASWRDGVSVSDCVRNGEKLAERLN